MAEWGKETVIIVHGTWAAPESGTRRWYQPSGEAPTCESFIAKLDAALQERGSPARCWAHGGQENQIFQWSGENSWIARTCAASALGDYVVGLQRKGWRCHIVAHSHGGNVVLEGLPQIMMAPGSNELLGKIVTLGTPFMDTMSPILKTARRETMILSVVSWTGFVFVTLGFLSVFRNHFLTHHDQGGAYQGWIPGYILDWASYVAMIFLFVSVVGLFVRRRNAHTGRPDFSVLANAEAQAQPSVLAISSRMDESWQILHHMQSLDNPLAVKSSLISYLFSALRLHISRNAEVARMKGAKSFSDLGFVGKLFVGFLHFDSFAVILFAVVTTLDPSFIHTLPDKENPGLSYFAYAFMLHYAYPFMVLSVLLWALYFTKPIWETFHSALSSAYRSCTRLVGSLSWAPAEIGTFMVRRKGWSILQRIATGHEDYRYQLPMIEQRPSYVPKNFIKYEDMAKGAEQRALAMRNAWISRHFGDESQAFSKMMVTAAQINSLLRIVEADRSLVHNAYYTDDECIARVADWISGKG